MKASALKHAILSLTILLASLLFIFLPFDGFLTVWGSSIIGHYTALRLWDEVLLGICMLGTLYLVCFDRKVRAHTVSRKLTWLIGAYVVLQVVTGLFFLHKHELSSKAFGYGLIVNLRFLLFFLVTWAISIRTDRLHRRWLKLVIVPATIVIGFAMLQIFVLPNNFLNHFGYGATTIAPYQTVNSNSHYVRIESTLRGVNVFGAYLLIPLSVAIVGIAKSPRRSRYWAIVATGLVALFFTFSRSAFLGFLLSAATVIGLSLRRLTTTRTLQISAVFILVLLVVGIGFRHNTRYQNIVLHTQQHSSVASTSDGGHTKAIVSGLKQVAHHPLGHGPGSAGPASLYNNQPPQIAEDYYIQVGQETGVLGLAIFVLISAVVGYLLWLRRSDYLALSLLASLIGISFVNLLLHAWTDDTLSYIWWGLAGIAIAQAVQPRLVSSETTLRSKTKRKLGKS